MSTIIISLLLFIVIAIVYLLKYQEKSTEHFDIAEKPNTFAQAYLKNMDLDYIAKKLDIPVSVIDLVKSNQIAPIVNPSLGVEEQKDAIVPVVEKSNRIPDNHSDSKNYIIPMPKFEDIGLKQKIKESFTKEVVSKPQQIKVVAEQKNLSTCKFIGSFSADSKCPRDYPVHTGASISNNKSLTCNGTNIEIKQAKTIALINKGKISSIQLVDGGENYTKPPRVLVRSTGEAKEEAVLRANIRDGKVISISITNPGDGYRDTPKILIEKPSKQVYCNLCCKHEL